MPESEEAIDVAVSTWEEETQNGLAGAGGGADKTGRPPSELPKGEKRTQRQKGF